MSLGHLSSLAPTEFGLSVNRVIWSIRVSLVVVPITAGLVAHRLCRDLSARDAEPPDTPSEGPPPADAPAPVAIVDQEPEPDGQEPIAWPPPVAVASTGLPPARPLGS